jgi:DNA polymerase-4
VVEVWGWDEAAVGADTDDPETLATDIRRAVPERTELTCAVGIGDNRLRAKIATGFAKPGGVFRLTGATWYAVLGDRPVDALWGIGRKTAARLGGLGIHTVRELAAADTGDLASQLGPAIGPWLVRLARGEHDSPVTGTPYVARSLGREITYQRDLDDWDAVRTEVARPAGRGRGRGPSSGPDRGQGTLRALHHPYAGPGARRVNDRAGRPDGPRPLHHPAARTPAGRARRVREEPGLSRQTGRRPLARARFGVE